MDPSLAAWLNKVWAQAASTATEDLAGMIYSIYEDTGDEDEVKRKFTSMSSFKNFEMSGTAPRDIGAYESPSDPLMLGGDNTGAGYLYVKSKSFVEGGSTHRIVIHATPYNRLIGIMRLVCRDIVKPEWLFPDVNGAKVMTPDCFLSGRNDTLIIYARSRDGAMAAARHVMALIREGEIRPDSFVGKLPMTIHQLCPGVGYACEPPSRSILKSYTKPLSYGRFLSHIISIAVELAKEAGSSRVGDAPTFLTVASKVLGYAGINASTPYEFGTMHVAFSGSIPWPIASGPAPLKLAPWTDMRWN